MSDKTRARLSAVALILGFAALCVIALLTAIHAVGTDAELYYAEQVKAGVVEADLQALDHRMADYLAGNRAALEVSPPFNAREMTHMADCFQLFALLRKMRSRLIPWAILLTLGGAWLSQDRRLIRRGAWIAPLAVLLPLGGFAVYAALDFDAAFVLFHRLLFTNDLWLLNPATDLLIRVCPASMFMAMGVRIAAYSLLSLLATAGTVTALTIVWPRKRGKDTWKTTMRRGPAPRRIDFGNRGTR